MVGPTRFAPQRLGIRAAGKRGLVRRSLALGSADVTLLA
jgi:hypothetical protein